MTFTKTQTADAQADLKKILSPSSTVYTSVKHVSRSGMMRVISVYVVRDGEILDISHNVARALGWSFDLDRYGVKVSGAGMDMTFHTVYSLSSRLFQNGYALDNRNL